MYRYFDVLSTQGVQCSSADSMGCAGRTALSALAATGASAPCMMADESIGRGTDALSSSS